MITATTKRIWEVHDGSKPGHDGRVMLQPGTYVLERLPNPYGHDANWLVLEGTSIGMAEKAWHQWTNGDLVDNPHRPDHGKPIDWGDFEILIVETEVDAAVEK